MNIDRHTIAPFARPALIAVMIAVSGLASAESEPKRCVAASVPRAAIAEKNGGWVVLTPEQWQFLRGVYAMNPMTPPGLPPGDQAVLATVPGQDEGLIFFLDGASACTPMSAPKELIDLLQSVGAGDVAHESGAL
jgi:hypothetical protein